MKTSLALFFLVLSFPLYSQLVINEVDSDTPGTDVFEFVELYGLPNTNLTGKVLVFFNGLDDLSYHKIDLDGYLTDAFGFFLLGNSDVENVDAIFPDNLLQNGSDAVALYNGNGSDWPTGSPITSTGIIDAVVFDTDDADDLELLSLTSGQPQVNEGAQGFATLQSISRVPDGGTPLITATYVSQLPTPGYTNVLECNGGLVQTIDGETSLVMCNDEDNDPIEYEQITTTPLASYAWVVTSTTNIILFYTTISEFDPDVLPPGTCRVWGLSYTGTIDPETTGNGDLLDGIISSGCVSHSFNYVQLVKELCNDPECDGGAIGDDDGDIYVVACLDNDADIIQFNYDNNATTGGYAWFITDVSGTIVTQTSGSSFDFNETVAGTYRVHGVSFEGSLDPATTEVGDNITGVLGLGYCFDASDNFLTVISQPCESTPGCSNLFFSEYIEGASNNKAMEIFNPTSDAINLDGYVVYTYNNGATSPTNTFYLTGNIAPGEVFVIANTQADPFILAQTDFTSSVTWYNGNDAIILSQNGEAIDAIGIIGDDPITAWPVGTGTTGEQTLVRKVEITDGTTDWVLGASQWDVYPQNTFSYLGAHTIIPCQFSATPQISFSIASQSVNEDAGTATITVNVFNPIYETTATLSVTGGSALELLDYSDALPIQLTFPQGVTTPQTIEITIINDSDVEDEETIELTLMAGDEVEVLQQVHTITIEPSDQLIPEYDIIEITGIDASGVADSLGLQCILTGIVHGVNTYPIGLQFTLIDVTDGINVFAGADNFGYAVQEGDMVQLTGVIAQFNGLAQMEPTALSFITSGNAINSPETVSELSETTESQIVKLKCVEIVDLSQWTNVDPGFNVEVTNGVETWEVRIDADTEMFGDAPPEGHFTVSGIGGQFDTTSPLDEGYQLLPRYWEDFSDPVNAAFATPDDIFFFLGESINVVFDNQSEGAISYEWDFGDDGTSDEENPEHLYAFDFLVDNSTITISLTVTGDENCSDETEVTMNATYVGIDENDFLSEILAYPNPSNDFLTLESPAPIDHVEILNSVGQVVLSEIVGEAKKITLNIEKLAEGIYLWNVLSGERKISGILKKE